MCKLRRCKGALEIYIDSDSDSKIGRESDSKKAWDYLPRGGLTSVSGPS